MLLQEVCAKKVKLWKLFLGIIISMINIFRKIKTCQFTPITMNHRHSKETRLCDSELNVRHWAIQVLVGKCLLPQESILLDSRFSLNQLLIIFFRILGEAQRRWRSTLHLKNCFKNTTDQMLWAVMMTTTMSWARKAWARIVLLSWWITALWKTTTSPSLNAF